MMSEQIHLIIRLSGDGSVYATSPQAPGLVYGRSSLAELRSDLEDVLSFHFGRPGRSTSSSIMNATTTSLIVSW